jgi:hypothetical protein
VGMPPPLDCCGRYTIHAADCANVWTQVSPVTIGRKTRTRLKGDERRGATQRMQDTSVLFRRNEGQSQESLLLSVLRDRQIEFDLQLNEQGAQHTKALSDLTKIVHEKHTAAIECCKSLKQSNSRLEVRVTALTKALAKRKRPEAVPDATAADDDDDALVGELPAVPPIGDLDPADVAGPSSGRGRPRGQVLHFDSSGEHTRTYASVVKFGRIPNNGEFESSRKFSKNNILHPNIFLRAAGLAARTTVRTEPVSQYRVTTGLAAPGPVAPGADPWWPMESPKRRGRAIRANPVRLKGFTSRVLRGALLRVDSPGAARPCALAAHLVPSPGNRAVQRAPVTACAAATKARMPVPTVLDSGANACLFKDEDHFVTLDKTQRSKWTVADGDVQLASSGVGTVHYSVWNDVSNEPLQLVLPDVCWCPTASYNLISVSTLEDLHQVYCNFVDRVASTPGGDVQIRIERMDGLSEATRGMYCLNEPAPL